MSSTEIYGFRKSGYAFHLANICNAWRGAMAVWQILEMKYLPSLPPPRWAITPKEKAEYHHRTSIPGWMPSSGVDPMHEIWELFKDPRLKRMERICLATTFDNGIVMAKDFRECGDALYRFQGETSLKEQAAIILNCPGSVIAIGWNQTSVNGDTWTSSGLKGRAYNLFKQNEHFNIFDRDEIKNAPQESLMERLI